MCVMTKNDIHCEIDGWADACGVAYDSAATAQTLDRLARITIGLRAGRSYQRGVAQHPNTSVDTLMYLTGDPDWMVLKYISCNSKSTADILWKLVSGDGCDAGVVECVLEHPNSTREIYELLARDESWGARSMVAHCRRTPPDILTVLALDPHVDVQADVALNPSTPPLVKLWLQSGQYGGMTLEEFLEASSD
jgi:hypothetical protein